MIKNYQRSNSVLDEKRFYNRETISFIRISPLAESTSTLSSFAEILELIKGLIMMAEKGRGI